MSPSPRNPRYRAKSQRNHNPRVGGSSPSSGISLISISTEHEPRTLRHQRDRHVEQEIALPDGIVGVGLPVEAVILVFGYAKRSTPVERFKLCDESDGPSYCA